MATSAVMGSTPVDQYYQSLEGFHNRFKQLFPCTYCMYKTAIPHKDYDILELIQKVIDLTVLFFVVSWCALHISVVLWLFPVLPIGIDLARLALFQKPEDEKTVQKTNRFTSLFF